MILLVRHQSSRNLDETEAPASSHLGTQADANMKWLFLKDFNGISRGGTDIMYCIETAGGNKLSTCKGQELNIGAQMRHKM